MESAFSVLNKMNELRPEWAKADKPDRTEDAFRLVQKLKDGKRKCDVTLMLDGSGKVAKVKVCEYV